MAETFEVSDRLQTVTRPDKTAACDEARRLSMAHAGTFKVYRVTEAGRELIAEYESGTPQPRPGFRVTGKRPGPALRWGDDA